MDVATSTAAERIARTLAAQAISANGEGMEESASPRVDEAWRDHLPAAILVLKTLREPSRAMAEAGDPAVWERMILAAVEEAQPAGQVM